MNVARYKRFTKNYVLPTQIGITHLLQLVCKPLKERRNKEETLLSASMVNNDERMMKINRNSIKKYWVFT